jgi:hypothetical protein
VKFSLYIGKGTNIERLLLVLLHGVDIGFCNATNECCSEYIRWIHQIYKRFLHVEYLILLHVCVILPQESVNHSLLNLLTYLWIEEKVARGELLVHGGYYDFVDCTFEKWTLDYEGGNLEENSRFVVKNQFYWC